MPVHASSQTFIRLLQFIEGRREALTEAAGMLGGPGARHRMLHLIEALTESSPEGRMIRRGIPAAKQGDNGRTRPS